MASTLDTVTVDCADPRRLADFWIAMLDPEGNEFCILRGPQDGRSAEG